MSGRSKPIFRRTAFRGWSYQEKRDANVKALELAANGRSEKQACEELKLSHEQMEAISYALCWRHRADCWDDLVELLQEEP